MSGAYSQTYPSSDEKYMNYNSQPIQCSISASVAGWCIFKHTQTKRLEPLNYCGYTVRMRVIEAVVIVRKFKEGRFGISLSMTIDTRPMNQDPLPL